jgi:hypothetical protein
MLNSRWGAARWAGIQIRLLRMSVESARMQRFRHLLLCLMMLALPLQGFAAASMLYCGVGAGSPAEVGQMETVTSHHHTAEAVDMQHDHSGFGQTSHAAEPAPDNQKHLPDASHKCGVCSACCSVVAISGFLHTVEVQPSPKADLVELFVLIHTVPSRLPKKPPRA